MLNDSRLKTLMADRLVREIVEREQMKVCVVCGQQKEGCAIVPETSKHAGRLMCPECVGWLVDTAVRGRVQAERAAAEARTQAEARAAMPLRRKRSRRKTASA